jgi:hypothetical protein
MNKQEVINYTEQFIQKGGKQITEVVLNPQNPAWVRREYKSRLNKTWAQMVQSQPDVPKTADFKSKKSISPPPGRD